MKLHCDYTKSTKHQFYNSCSTPDNTINIQGLCSDQILENILCVNPVHLWTQFSIPETVDLSYSKPDIKSIDSIYTCVEVISQRVIYTPVLSDISQANWEGSTLTGKKLILDGLLKQKIIYTSDNPIQPVQSVNFITPFSTFIVVDSDSRLSQKFKIDTCLEDVFAYTLSPRSIYKNTTLFIKATPLC